jgi:hypothetical protein
LMQLIYCVENSEASKAGPCFDSLCPCPLYEELLLLPRARRGPAKRQGGMMCSMQSVAGKYWRK